MFDARAPMEEPPTPVLFLLRGSKRQMGLACHTRPTSTMSTSSRSRKAKARLVSIDRGLPPLSLLRLLVSWSPRASPSFLQVSSPEDPAMWYHSHTVLSLNITPPSLACWLTHAMKDRDHFPPWSGSTSLDVGRKTIFFHTELVSWRRLIPASMGS